jgi:molybdenum cofactor synthesis domain-containing protein
MATPRASMIVIGDEILDGYVEEANAAWTSRQLRERGVALERVATVRDEVASIRDEIERALAGPRPAAVLTSGGVGGTWDDVTYAAVAEALGVPLRLDPGLARPVEGIIEWAHAQGFTFDEDSVQGMLRIATVPQGAKVHHLRTYLACVRCSVDGGLSAPAGAEVIVLPGPPGHFRALMEEVVLSEVFPDDGTAPHVVEVTHDYPETLLVGPMRRIRQRYDSVTVGSYPGATMLVRFQGPLAAAESAAAQLRRELRALDAHPAADRLKEAWQQQAASWAPDQEH